MWAAVLVGHGKEQFTHENGKKRFTFKLLPNATLAPEGKPRGITSFKNAIADRVRVGSFVDFDKWMASAAAIKALSYKHAPPINHTFSFRDRMTGFHSNDIESEFARVKRCLRERHGRLTLAGGSTRTEAMEGDLYAYMFYINNTNDMKTVVKAMREYSC